ncbi:MAG TPA: hypothetical protein PKN09_12490 [Novosphingobium sp.]|nr:hypothetical protein [Novosphingobium sp.]
MTFDWATVTGLAGSALFLGAFAYANATENLDKLWFNLLNLIGAVLLLISLWVHFNLAAFVLEVCWGLLAAHGFYKAVIDRRSGTGK